MSQEERKKTEEEEKEEQLEKLKKEWPIEEDISFNEFNITEKLQNNAFLFAKYQDQLNREKAVMDKLLELKEKIIGDVYNYYRFEDDRQLQKPEIEKYYLPRDKKIIRINAIIRKQQTNVDYFTLCCKALDKVGWNMKNFLEAHRSF